jgi:hypothetical protein
MNHKRDFIDPDVSRVRLLLQMTDVYVLLSFSCFFFLLSAGDEQERRR